MQKLSEVSASFPRTDPGHQLTRELAWASLFWATSYWVLNVCELFKLVVDHQQHQVNSTAEDNDGGAGRKTEGITYG